MIKGTVFSVMWNDAYFDIDERVIKDAFKEYFHPEEGELLHVEEIDEPCRHQNCSMVSGRKRDYLYCDDCKTNLQDDGE